MCVCMCVCVPITLLQYDAMSVGIRNNTDQVRTHIIIKIPPNIILVGRFIPTGYFSMVVDYHQEIYKAQNATMTTTTIISTV